MLACVLVLALPDKQIKSLAISITHLLTDRQLHIGTLKLERSFNPSLTLTEVRFSNADWASEESLFSAENISATVNLPELFKGQLVIQDVTSTAIKVHLEVDEAGEKNWQLSSEPMTLPPFSRLTIVSADANDTLVTFLDRRTSGHQLLIIDKVALNNDANDTSAQVQLNGKINALPVSATLALQADEFASLSISDALRLPYSLDMSAGELQITANGQLNDIGEALSIDTDMSMDINSLADLGDIINQPLPDIGPVNVNARLSANPETIAETGLQIPDLRLTISDPLLQLQAQGQFSDVPATNSGSVNLSLEIPDTDKILSMLNVSRRIPGTLNLKASLTGSEREFDAQLQSVNFKSRYIDAELNGTVSDILGTASVDASLKLDTPDLSLVTQLFGTEMPSEWGPITAQASLQGETGNYALNNIDATLNGNSTASVTGSIKSLIPFDSMHLDVDVSLSTLDEVSTFTRNPLPDIGPMTGTGIVGWKEGKLFLQNANVKHDSQYGVAVVTGNIGDLIHFDRVRLRADADLPDFAALDLFTGFELPAVDRVTASTNLISANALDLSARQLTVTTTIDGLTVVANGAVESFIKPYISVDLDLESSIESISQLNEISGKQLPGLGPITATARLKGVGKDFVLEDINAILSDSKLAGTLTSQLDDLTAFDKLAFDVTLQTDNVATVASEFGFDSSISAPATLTSKIRIDGKDLQLENTDVAVASNRANANVSLLNVFDAQQKTMIRGDVSLLDVDTSTLFKQAEEDQEKTKEPDEHTGQSPQPPGKDRLLSTQRLPINFMRDDDIDIDVQIQSLSSELLEIENTNFLVTARNGVFSIKPFTGTVNGGKVELTAILDTRSALPVVNINLALNEIDLARAMVFDGTELIESTGSTWAELAFTGEGSSIAQILASATGEGGFYIENLLFNEKILSLFSSDLLDQLTDALNPFADRDMMGTQLLCSAITFQIHDGVLQTPFGFAVEASDYSVVGDGQVDFNDETLEIMFNSKPKTGLGIGLNRLANLVKLDGALASPSLTLSEVGLLQFGASVAAAVASGGVTLIAEGLYNKHAAMSDVCAQALGN